MDDHTIFRIALLEQCAERIALFVRQVLLPQQRIAERQTGGNAVLLRQRQHLARIVIAEASAAAAPQAVARRAIDRADRAPIVEPVPVRAVQRQKRTVQLVKLKQAGKMVICCFFRIFRLLSVILPSETAGRPVH